MIENIFNLLAALHHRFFSQNKLRPYEELCLCAWVDSLSSHAKLIIKTQLASPYFVQRQAAGAKVCFYWKNKNSLPEFKFNEPDLHVATVVLQDERGNKISAKIYIHRGYFFSIEFPKRPERYMVQHDMACESLRVEEVKTRVEL